MTGGGEAVDQKKLSEKIVKAALGALDWAPLKVHLDQLEVSQRTVAELCGHVRRHSDLICKYPRESFEARRTRFFEDMRCYVDEVLGSEAATEIDDVMGLLAQIEHGYRSILGALSQRDIGREPATVRVSGVISRACHQYREVNRLQKEVIAKASEINLMSGVRVPDDEGQTFDADAFLDGLSESVSMTLIMEAINNKWFDNDIVALPDLPQVDDQVRHRSGSTQMLALCWRQWQRVEKRRRYLGGIFVHQPSHRLPIEAGRQAESVLTYHPEDGTLNEREVYDFLANSRLRDRLVQTYFSMEVEHGFSSKGFGINNGAELPPAQFVSLEEAHAGNSLSEVLGYSIMEDDERPEQLLLREWVRGYIVLKEIAKERTSADSVDGDGYAVLMQDHELTSILERCGFERDTAIRFVSLTLLHRSARDMFDCPLIRVGASAVLLFTPAVIDLNVAMAVLSNLSNRGAQLGRKGLSFEKATHGIFRRHGLPVFNFHSRRDGEDYEYDAIVPWDGYLFVLECKNRSLSAADPAQIYYFDLEISSDAKQVRRLADALKKYPDIVSQQIGPQYVEYEVVPCVVHSLPYSRAGDVEGVFFSDWSAIARFFDDEYFWIKVPHRVGRATILHRTAIRKIWKGASPAAADFLSQLRGPFQLELLMKHLAVVSAKFGISPTEVVMTSELVRSEMNARSISEAAGMDADDTLRGIALVADNAKEARSELEQRASDQEQQKCGSGDSGEIETDAI